MTSISATSSIQAALRAFMPPSAGPGAAAAAGTATPASVVQLSPEGLARQAADRAPPPMSTSLRFKGLGAALLGAFAARAAAPADPQPLPQDLDNKFSLNVTTASGKQLALTLGNRGEEMFFALEADADINDAEREAISALAKGFQDAIDGMAQADPSVRLAGLAELGGLQSIRFRSEVSTATQPGERMSMDFHIDGGERRVRIDGPRGSVEVKVDTSRPELLGSRQQQEKAIGRYLKQVDQAAQRGRGDAQLVAMFKDAFSGLSRTAAREDAAADATASTSRWVLQREDHAVLTGLSDFHASIGQAAQHINPARRDEVDDFNYELSQESSLGGDAFLERTISQRQASRLSAQFHEALTPGGSLALDFRSESQNYRYRQINDSATSSVELGYKDGRLHKARLEQSVSQSERVREYVFGRLKSDLTMPDEYAMLRDLVAVLAPYQAGQGGNAAGEGREAREERRRIALDALGDDVLLPGSRFELAERDARMSAQP